MPLWKRTYRCPNTECHLAMDRDENSVVNILKWYLARLGPHTERISVRCADVFTAIDDVNTCRKAENKKLAPCERRSQLNETNPTFVKPCQVSML